MALPEIYNFTVEAGDNAILEFSVTTGPIEVDGAAVSFAVYEQLDAAPVDPDVPVFEKELDYGIEAENDGTVTTFSIEFEQADTSDLTLGNYYYEAKIVDGFGKNRTAAAGLITVTGRSATLSVRQLKLRFPELADVNDSIVAMAIAMATSIVGNDDDWIEADVAPARLFLAAHLIATAPEVSGGQAEASIASESIGRLSISYTSMSSSDRVSMLSTSRYGTRYLELMRGSHGGPLVI